MYVAVTLSYDLPTQWLIYCEALWGMCPTNFQWCSQVPGRPGPPKYLTVKDEDTLIEQSYILLKQSVSQVVPCQLTGPGYITVQMLSRSPL